MNLEIAGILAIWLMPGERNMKIHSHGKRSVPIVHAVQSLRSVQAATVAARRI
jgi:hypothetical protein